MGWNFFCLKRTLRPKILSVQKQFWVHKIRSQNLSQKKIGSKKILVHIESVSKKFRVKNLLGPKKVKPNKNSFHILKEKLVSFKMLTGYNFVVQIKCTFILCNYLSWFFWFLSIIGNDFRKCWTRGNPCGEEVVEV